MLFAKWEGQIQNLPLPQCTSIKAYPKYLVPEQEGQCRSPLAVLRRLQAYQGVPTATLPGWDAAVTTRYDNAMHRYPDHTG